MADRRYGGIMVDAEGRAPSGHWVDIPLPQPPETGTALGPHILDPPSPDLPISLTNGPVLPFSESWIRFLGRLLARVAAN
jgi:hypothetical protein